MELSLAAFALHGLDFSGYTKYGQAHILLQENAAERSSLPS